MPSITEITRSIFEACPMRERAVDEVEHLGRVGDTRAA
jgi:hypothetical protein